MEKRDGIKNFRHVSHWWLAYSGGYSALHWGLGIAAIVFSTAIASNQTLFSSEGTWLFQSEKYFSAVSTGLLAFFGASEKGNRYRKAHRILRNAIDKFDYDKSYTFNYVEEAHDQGVSIIDQAPVMRTHP